jgi:hypothetical protein
MPSADAVVREAARGCIWTNLSRYHTIRVSIETPFNWER